MRMKNHAADQKEIRPKTGRAEKQIEQEENYRKE
jgi:hypothetical protein